MSDNSLSWFSLYATRLARYLRGGLEFVFSPRRYLRSIETESNEESAHRIAALALAFAAVVLLIGTQSLPPYRILWLGLLESLLGLGLVPVFYVVVRVFGGGHPWKVALVYVLTARFTLLLPAYLSYVFFIATEDYVFALLKGIFATGYLLLLFLVLPFSYFDKVRQRVGAFAVAVAAFYCYTYALDTAFSFTTSSTSRFAQLSLFYDPIGGEVDRLADYSQETLALYKPAQLRRGLDVIFTAERDTSAGLLIFHRDSLRALHDDWISERPRAMARWADLERVLTTNTELANFRTTKRHLGLRSAHLEAARAAARDLDHFVNEPRARNLMPLQASYMSMQDREIAYQRAVIELSTVRSRLVRLGLLSLDPVVPASID